MKKGMTSQQLIPAKRNYVIIEWEALAMIFTMKNFHHYLLGNKFTVVTDHEALKYLLSKPNLTGKIAWWILFLQEYEFTIKDRPGKNHRNDDALSRTYEEVGDHLEDDDFLDAKLFALDAKKVLKEYKKVVDYLLHHKFPNGTNK